MGRFVNPGNSAFKVALASEIYIDKTNLLDFTNSVLGTKQAYICNSRPRRFGKSITADMLTAYYSKGCDSRELFMNYNIAQTEDFEKYLNKYDVIHLDMQWILMDAGAPERISGYINKNVISELADLYKDIDLRNQKTLYGALSVINSMTNNKFVIIIDEWDVLIRDEAANSSVQEEYINFLRGMFKGSEPTKYIELAFLTGILPIKKLKTQSALNNFDEYTMLYAGRLSPYIGFTEDEVRDICDRYGRDFTQVERWYDGYMLGDYHVYNPRAVVNYMLHGDLKSYWSETGSYDVIVPLINLDFDGLKTAIIQMLSGGEIKVNTGSFMNDTVSFKNKDDVLTYLIHLGYLGFDQKRSCAFIPNEEIRQDIENARAVVNYMLQGDLKSYWSETGSYDVIVPLINLDFDGLKTAIIQMLSGGEIKVNTGSFMNDTVSFKNKDDVLTYLVHLGYLGFDQKKSCAFIPNEEIRQDIENACRHKL